MTALVISREAYMASPLGKTRKAVAEAAKNADRVTAALARVSCALTRGDGTSEAIRALDDAMRDLRIATGQVGELARVVEAEGVS